MACFETWITAYGGVGTGTVARFAQKNSLTGFEWAVGIPGTLCGAAFMNANGYGSKMRNVVEEVYAVSIDGEIDKVYGWRWEILKKSRQKWMTIRNPAERSSPWTKEVQGQCISGRRDTMWVP